MRRVFVGRLNQSQERTLFFIDLENKSQQRISPDLFHVLAQFITAYSDGLFWSMRSDNVS